MSELPRAEAEVEFSPIRGGPYYECPRCRGPMRILATIHPPETTSAILACIGLPVRAPPLAPARCDDGFGDEADKQAPADFEP